MDGLIIKPKWMGKILIGEKELEVRGHRTAKQGEKIFLLESGTQRVAGTARILCCIPIDKENWEFLRPKHCVNLSYYELLKVYKKPYYWVLSDVKKYDEIFYYKHPKGAVIWVKDVKVN